MEQITTVGVDLAKSIFQVHCNDSNGRMVLNKKVRRRDLLMFMSTIRPCLVGMESCCGSHYWARKFTECGHTVKLIPAQYVKPYVKTNKNDAADAEAIAEAVTKPNMRFVPIKEPYQQNIQMLRRIRSRLVGNRTALCNSARGFLMERGIIMSKGIQKLRKDLPNIISDAENELTDMAREEMHNLYSELCSIDVLVTEYDRKIQLIYDNDEACKRIGKINGVGIITATYVRAVMGDPRTFKNGRQFAAWLGLVPRQHSSGGRNNLLGLSKRGDIYLRMLLIHGARTVVMYSEGKKDRLNRWAQDKIATRGFNKACVAVANKNARIIWAMLAHGEEYKMAA